jgi:hypothetical protein
MNHNRDSTVSSIVDLYGTDNLAQPPIDRLQHPSIQEEEEEGEGGGEGYEERDRQLKEHRDSSYPRTRGLPDASDRNGNQVFPAFNNPTPLAPPISPAEPVSLQQPQHTLHQPRSVLTSVSSSYEPSSTTRHRQQSSTDSSLPGRNGVGNGGEGSSSIHHQRINGPRGLVGINNRYNDSSASFVSIQQPGEEDDAFHVRSTCKLVVLATCPSK